MKKIVTPLMLAMSLAAAGSAFAQAAPAEPESCLRSLHRLAMRGPDGFVKCRGNGIRSRRLH